MDACAPPTDNPGPDFAPPPLHASAMPTRLATYAFALKSTSPSAFRRGSLALTRAPAAVAAPNKNGSKTMLPPGVASGAELRGRIDTPGLLVHSRRLLVPHLTHDTLHLVSPPGAHMVDLSAERMLKHFPGDTDLDQSANQYPGTLRQFANLHDAFHLLTLRDAALDDPQAPPRAMTHGNDHVLARTHRGLQKVTPAWWMRVVERGAPDLAAVPAHVLLPGANVSRKIASRAVVRSAAYLDACLAIRDQESDTPQPPLWATVSGYTPSDLVAAARLMADRASKVSGFVLDAPALADLNPVAPLLPPTLPRYALSVYTPDAMARHLHVADMFSSAATFTLASAGWAWNLDLNRPTPDANAVFSLWDESMRTSSDPLIGSAPSQCPCWACANHNRAYVYHLLDCHEMLGWTLLAIHNLHQLELFLASIRAAIDSASSSTSSEDLVQSRIDTWLAMYEAHVVPLQNKILAENGLVVVGQDGVVPDRPATPDALPVKRRRLEGDTSAGIEGPPRKRHESSSA
ncbi:tRNA-guanine(15) transglycosylase-like protein [Blastocladiella britannica]|nr:tRNA-guanine(15) transglycosylase-like protein [Blastocladiella britannica]